MIQFLLFAILGFIGMEIFSYFAHRFLFHGIFWKIHVAHHQPRKSFFELNDIFSLIFALITITLIIFGNEFAAPIGFGIAVYGVLYFIVHDLFTHRRFLPFKSKNEIILNVRAAHQKHHQSVKKAGLEPFGLFLFNYKKN
ncbi:MAG: sterol desaturase family protein [Pyrinomonadaceae bacterium]